jgi:hypothetical protein
MATRILQSYHRIFNKEEQTTRDHHCDYYAGFLQEREVWVKGESQQKAVQEIEEEIDNVRSAWRWAAQGRDSRALEQASSCLRYFYQIRGFYQEGEAAFRLAADNLTQESVTYGRLLIYQGLFTWWLGRSDAAQEVLERSLAWCRVAVLR